MVDYMIDNKNTNHNQRKMQVHDMTWHDNIIITWERALHCISKNRSKTQLVIVMVIIDKNEHSFIHNDVNTRNGL